VLLTARRVVRKASSSEHPAVRRSYRLARRTARSTINAVTGRQMGWMATLRTAHWVDATTFELAGWAYERGYAYPDAPPRIRVWIENGATRIDATVESRVDTEANALARKAEFDYANTGFVARFDLSALPAQGPATWQVKLAVSDGTRTRQGTFKFRYRGGAARHLFTHTFDDDLQISPAWGGTGLRLLCRRAVTVADRVDLDGRRVQVAVRSRGPVLTAAALVGSAGEVPLECRPVAGSTDRYEVRGVVPDDLPLPEGRITRAAVWLLEAADAEGNRYPVRTDLDDSPPEAPATATLFASSAGGTLRLNDAPAQVLVEECDLETEPRLGLRYRGRVLGDAGGTPVLYALGPRQDLPVEVTPGPDGTFEAFMPLLVSVWRQQALPPRTGSYVLRATDSAGTELRVSTVPALTALAPRIHALPTFRLHLQTGVLHQLRLKVTAARRSDELGSFHQQRLQRVYRTTQWTPRNAVYFESFYGRNATDNPRALDGEVARHYPQLTRFWGIDDGSIPTPEGSIAVIRGTREWWEARAMSRYVVANDWLRRQFRPQPFQVVLQTWHGSMLKRIGLDRPNLPPSKQRVILRERRKWDLLLSQNHHSTEILASAYAWDRPIMEEGYPRDDALSTGDGSGIRAQLGIPPDKKAVLYAPTWRENLTSMVTFLDLERLTRELGPDYVLLLRGHSRTVAHGGNVTLPGVIDVTTYPDITELFLAADVLVTDYSSVMFDFSITRRPMVFFVPDMDDYRDSTRGVYFDLSELAPGPVLFTQDEVTAALLEVDTQPARYAELYDAWVQRFNHHDDGHAAERIVAALLAHRK
jgi:CDP-glycerol glycerophosphotransferase